jgi:hypothetical protein
MANITAKGETGENRRNCKPASYQCGFIKHMDILPIKDISV